MKEKKLKPKYVTDKSAIDYGCVFITRNDNYYVRIGLVCVDITSALENNKIMFKDLNEKDIKMIYSPDCMVKLDFDLNERKDKKC